MVHDKENFKEEVLLRGLEENVEGKCSAKFTAISTVIQGLRMQTIPLLKGIFIILTLVLKNVRHFEILRLLASKLTLL